MEAPNGPCIYCGWWVTISEGLGYTQDDVIAAIGSHLICDECRHERAEVPASQDESEFQTKVIDLAEGKGWRVYHVSNVKGRLINKTAVGFPDLVLAKWSRRRLLIVELKREDGVIRPTQEWWIAILRSIPGVDMRVWRPSDWPEIGNVLEGPNYEGATMQFGARL